MKFVSVLMEDSTYLWLGRHPLARNTAVTVNKRLLRITGNLQSLLQNVETFTLFVGTKLIENLVTKTTKYVGCLFVSGNTLL